MFRLPKVCRLAKSKPSFRRGSATVEMAFVAPFVFLLIFATLEFSRMVMIRQALSNAAREGCRHASLISTQHHSRADSVARDKLDGVIANVDDPLVVRIAFDPAFTTSPVSGTNITARVEVNCEDVSWLPPFFFSGAKISGTSSMDRE